MKYQRMKHTCVASFARCCPRSFCMDTPHEMNVNWSTWWLDFLSKTLRGRPPLTEISQIDQSTGASFSVALHWRSDVGERISFTSFFSLEGFMISCGYRSEARPLQLSNVWPTDTYGLDLLQATRLAYVWMPWEDMYLDIATFWSKMSIH